MSKLTVSARTRLMMEKAMEILQPTDNPLPEEAAVERAVPIFCGEASDTGSSSDPLDEVETDIDLYEPSERDTPSTSDTSSVLPIYTAAMKGDGCAVSGCVSGLVAHQLNLYPFPTDAELKRRDLWVKAVGKKNVPVNAKLCSFHFITGSPSDSVDHPDYVPSLHMKSFKDVDGKDADELNHLLKSTNPKIYQDYKPQGGSGSPLHGFKRNLKPEKVLNVVKLKSGSRLFLMKWEDDLCPDFVTTEDANEKCSDLVIQFYEHLIMWSG